MKCEKSGNRTISYQSLLLSTTILNDKCMHTVSLFNIIPTIYVVIYVPAKDPDFHDSIQVIIQLFLLALKQYSVGELL